MDEQQQCRGSLSTRDAVSAWGRTDARCKLKFLPNIFPNACGTVGVGLERVPFSRHVGMRPIQRLDLPIPLWLRYYSEAQQRTSFGCLGEPRIVADRGVPAR
jgi:hypothetical protein